MLTEKERTSTTDLSPELTDIFALLKDNISGLKGLIKNSEQDFLTISDKLHSYISRSRKLQDKSSNVAISITEKVLEKGISELNWLLKHISEFLSKSVSEIKTNKEQLDNVLVNIEDIIEQIDDFETIVKHLKMLGVSTKIESSRLGNDDEGFFALAEKVDNLSKVISEQTSTIFKKAFSLSNTIRKTTSYLSVMEKEQNNQVELIINKTNLTLGIFEKKCSESYKKADGIALNSEKIGTCISGIVTSVQFHDIIRQKMEHVQEALLATVENNTPLFEGKLIPHGISDELEIIHDVCELQTSQLESALSEFTSAVSGIISNLTEVDKNVDKILSETANFLGEKAMLSGDSLNEIQTDLSTISAGLRKGAEISVELSASIKSVLEIVENLAGHFSQIEEVGTEIEIIAINARIKAAHTGLNGTALGVLAESIQKLSLDAKERTGKTTKILERIETATHKLKTNASDKEEEDSQIIQLKIDEILKTIIEQYNHCNFSISEMKTEVEHFKKEIKKTAEGITIQNVAKSTISEIIKKLGRIVKTIKKSVKINANKEQNTQGLLNLYTMQSERNTHISFSNSNNNAYTVKLKDDGEKQENYLGDNVELF